MFALIDLEGIFGGPLGRAGRLGLVGSLGMKSLSTTGGSRCTIGADLTFTKGIFAGCAALAASSRSRLVGGRGGNFAYSNGGGIFLPSPIDDALVAEEPCPNDMPDMVELIDEFDARFTSCVDPLLGGRAGEGCVALRPGSGGGALRTGRV